MGGQSNNDLVIGKFDSSGNAETLFGGDGIDRVSLGGTEEIRGLIAQSDGSIIAAGLKGNDFVIAKLTSAGALDTKFGASSGYIATYFAGGTHAVYSLARQSDGKFVAAGVSGTDFGVARYAATGTLDTSFDGDGKLTTYIRRDGYLYGVAIGPDYKIAAAGYSGTAGYESTYNFAVARYKVASGLEERLYAQTDANHNVTSISDVFGSVKQRFIYDPYALAVLNSAGQVPATAMPGCIASRANATMRRPKRTTSTTGSTSRCWGTMFQADMSGYPDGANRYQFVSNNPIAFTDPSGLQKTVTAESTQTNPDGSKSLIRTYDDGSTIRGAQCHPCALQQHLQMTTMEHNNIDNNCKTQQQPSAGQVLPGTTKLLQDGRGETRGPIGPGPAGNSASQVQARSLPLARPGHDRAPFQ